MAAADAFVISAVQKGATVIGGITQQSMPVGSLIQRERTSGEIYNRFIALNGQAPNASFTTRSLALALTNFPIIGADLNAANLIIWAQRLLKGGTRSVSADHEKFTIGEGVLVPSRLSVAGQGDAEISYLASITGVTSIVRAAASLPAGFVDAQRYGLGATSVGGTGLTGITSFDIDFGINVFVKSADGDISPTFAAIDGFASILRWRTMDAGLFADISLGGKDATATPATTVLRQRADGGGYGGSDLTVTAYGLAVVENVFDVNGQETGESELRLETTYDGSNVPLAIA